ncbi:nuclear transport factor 2 family protein [Streptomyces sp. MNU76]|uniref:nuclear transport factor 2 family protein n=1 Tax=Streptomyces sp. MNU76 TaxID=2560026 RepID=UPI0035A8F6DF
MDTAEATERFVGVWQRAWAAHDVDAILESYARDCVHRSMPFREPHRGHGELAEYLRRSFTDERGEDVRFSEPRVGPDGVAVAEFRVLSEFDEDPQTLAGCVFVRFDASVPEVKALVYVAAFMPDKGEVLGELANRFPGSELNPASEALPDGAGHHDVAIKPDKFHDVFAADLPRSTTSVPAVSQRPVSVGRSSPRRRPRRGARFPPGSWWPPRTRPSPPRWSASRRRGRARTRSRSTPRTWR